MCSRVVAGSVERKMLLLLFTEGLKFLKIKKTQEACVYIFSLSHLLS